LNKAFGQHLLRNPGILDKIIEASELKTSDNALEIGPGTGNLTMKVLPLVKKLTAIEVDPRMLAEVKKRAFSEGRMNFEVKQGDALRTEFPPFDVCVANLPYQISSAFTFKLLAHRPLFRCAVIMFQYEFAERLVAQVGEQFYGRLALNVALFSVCTRVCKVAKGSFNPPPQVDSMVVKFVPRKDPINVDFAEWDGLLRICFNRKHKLLNANFKAKWVIKLLQENYKTYCALKGKKDELKGNFKDAVMSVLKESGLGEKRAISLMLEEYMQLLLAFHQKGMHFSSGSKTVKPEDMDMDDGEGDDGMEED
jgi:18S rRNA (adenine1779-N6/adenine1780-N6)-dimethyltransferase